MKLTIERSALLRCLSHVQSVVERRNTIPILGNVLLRGTKDMHLSLTATDMDLEIVETVPAHVATPGATTTPAHTLYDIVRKLSDGSQIELELSNNNTILTVRSGKSNFKLGCLPVSDFPQMSGGELDYNFSLPIIQVKNLVDRTKFAISTEETRYYLNGIYMHVAGHGKGARLRGVATDGHRLARMEFACPEGAEDIPGVIVPRKAALEVRKLVDDSNGAVGISMSETRIRFTLGNITLTSKLIDGTFPDYERVIPAGNDKRIEIEPRSFATAVDRVATIATEKSRAVKLAVDRSGLIISAQSADSGSAQEEIEVTYDAEPIEIGFNARYLLDIASQIEGDGVYLDVSDSASPTIIRDSADEGALYVLMPMRV